VLYSALKRVSVMEWSGELTVKSGHCDDGLCVLKKCDWEE
jgi:hypothetical protein